MFSVVYKLNMFISKQRFSLRNDSSSDTESENETDKNNSYKKRKQLNFKSVFFAHIQLDPNRVGEKLFRPGYMIALMSPLRCVRVHSQRTFTLRIIL